MKALPPSYAAWYAAERTRHFLFRPFDLATFLKLGAIAVFTEGTLVTLRFTVSTGAPSDTPSEGLLSEIRSLTQVPGFFLFAALGAIAAIVLGLLLYYLVVRLRFALFHSLVHQTKNLRPGWALYRTQADRFYNGCLGVWFGFLLLFLLFVGVVAIAAFTLFSARTEEGLLDPGVFLFLFFPCVGFAVLLLIAAAFAEVVMHDFILPHMALEDISFREAWRVVRPSIRAHREPFFSYLVLRIVLPLCAAVILVPLGLIAAWAIFGVLNASATGFNSMLEDATGLGAAVRIGLEILFGICAAIAGSLLAAALGGPLGIWLRTYALFFYGGYAKSLGDLLEPVPVEFLPLDRR